MGEELVGEAFMAADCRRRPTPDCRCQKPSIEWTALASFAYTGAHPHQEPTMKLIGSTASPYVRKVRVVMAEKKLDYRFVEDNVWADDSTITAANPLGKVPCLVLDGGDAMFDSRVIVEYLDTLSPVGKLIPASGRERAEVKTGEALADAMAGQVTTDEQLVYQIMLQVRGMLNKAQIHINEDSSIEISHHYGLRRFREYGAVIITCINRDYAKKLVIQLPRQKHPYHYHKKKEETFQLLAGDLEIVKDGHKVSMRPGDTLLVEPGQGLCIGSARTDVVSTWR